MVKELVESLHYFRQKNLGKTPDAIIMHHEDFFEFMCEVMRTYRQALLRDENGYTKFDGVKIIRTGDVARDHFQLMTTLR